MWHIEKLQNGIKNEKWEIKGNVSKIHAFLWSDGDVLRSSSI